MTKFYARNIAAMRAAANNLTLATTEVNKLRSVAANKGYHSAGIVVPHSLSQAGFLRGLIREAKFSVVPDKKFFALREQSRVK